MVDESFRNLHLEVVDLQQDLSSFRSVVRARRALERRQHAIRHTIQAVAATYAYNKLCLKFNEYSKITNLILTVPSQQTHTYHFNGHLPGKHVLLRLNS